MRAAEHWKRYGGEMQGKKIDRAKVKELYLRGLKSRQIAKEIQANESRVQKVIWELKQRGDLPQEIPIDENGVKARRHAGWTDEEIAFDMHRTLEEVQKVEGDDYASLHW